MLITEHTAIPESKYWLLLGSLLPSYPQNSHQREESTEFRSLNESSNCSKVCSCGPVCPVSGTPL